LYEMQRIVTKILRDEKAQERRDAHTGGGDPDLEHDRMSASETMSSTKAPGKDTILGGQSVKEDEVQPQIQPEGLAAAGAVHETPVKQAKATKADAAETEKNYVSDARAEKFKETEMFELLAPW
jgi:hypothetical protein